MKGFFRSRWSVIIGCVILVFLIVAFVRAYYQNYEVRVEISQLQAEASRLENKKIESLEVLKYVQSPAYVEAKARTELNMSKDGEQVAIIPQTGKIDSSGQNENSVVEFNSTSNLIKWWNYFFDN